METVGEKVKDKTFFAGEYLLDEQPHHDILKSAHTGWRSPASEGRRWLLYAEDYVTIW